MSTDKRTGTVAPKHTITLPPSDHQPSKAELAEEIELDVPGEDAWDRMNNLADALMRPVDIEYKGK